MNKDAASPRYLRTCFEDNVEDCWMGEGFCCFLIFWKACWKGSTVRHSSFFQEWESE